MTKIDLKDIEAARKEHGDSVSSITAKIKSLQSQRCRLKKFKDLEKYETVMTNLLKEEQILKEAKSSLEPKKKFVTEFNKSDVDRLDYDESRKALKSIQSKKCLSIQYGQEQEVQKAISIENLLKEHLEKVKPVEQSYIRRTDLNTIIEMIENDKTMTSSLILEHLKNL